MTLKEFYEDIKDTVEKQFQARITLFEDSDAIQIEPRSAKAVDKDGSNLFVEDFIKNELRGSRFMIANKGKGDRHIKIVHMVGVKPSAPNKNFRKKVR